METTHENSRLKLQFLPFATVKNLTKPSIERELLEKTSVLKSSKVRDLKSQLLPSATATVATDSGITLTHVKTEGVIPPSPPKIQEVDYFLNQPKIQPIDTQPLITIQNGNYGFLTEFNKISYLTPPKNRERDYLVTEPKIQLSDVGKSHLTFASHLLRNDKVQKANNGTITARISVTALLVSLLASCQPSYANNVKVQQRVNKKNTKFSLRLNSKSADSSQLEKINQLSFFDSFNCVDKVAVTSNNVLLSQSTSAAPQRQCGFFMSAIQQNGGIAPLCRVYTPKYDTRKGNMGSGTCTPRVKPDTLTISTVSGVSQSSTR